MMLIWINIISTLILVVPLLVTIAFYTLVERKIMASIQRRRGPNVTGVWGVLQPLADGLKLILNEILIPRQAISKIIFVLCPIFTFFFSLLSWAVIPFSNDNVFFDLYNSSLFVLAISSLSVYSIIFAGWSSNSKYALLGALRSISQMISYEICISSCLICVVICSGSLNISSIVNAQSNCWYIFPLAPIAVIYYISVLAETNRAPFDLPEAEAEIVAGYNIEYSGVVLLFFF